MGVKIERFGSYGGQPVQLYLLANSSGCVAAVTDFGARLVQMHVPDRTGRTADIVLGFDDLESYVKTDTYFGATCGRYCNRIGRGRFFLDGEAIQLSTNENGNHLHGGLVGFDKLIWNTVIDENANALTFTLVSNAGDEGYPGQLVTSSRYQLTDDNRLLLSMTGTTDVPTILNMVHHSYWNLGGHSSGDVLRHNLTLESDFYTPVDDELITTGEILSVQNTPYDFRSGKSIGVDIGAIRNAGFGRLTEEGGGYDHNFVLRGGPRGMRAVGSVVDPVSGRGLRLHSTEPGVQFYTGGYLNAEVVGKGTYPYSAFAGFTLETQKFPNSPNFSHFESSVLRPGEVYLHQMDVEFFNV